METQKSLKSDHDLYLENLRLQLAVEELSILNDISTTITSTQPIEEIINKIIKKCVKHLLAEQGAVLLLDEKDKNKKFHTMIRKQDSHYDLLPYRFDSQLTGWMLKNRSPLLINDLSKDIRFKFAVDKELPIRSILSVPLTLKGKMIGLLNVFNKHSDEGFTSDDQRLLSIIASQSAQIIENARLYEEEKALIKIKEEMKIAKEIQFNLLPKNIPSIQGYQLAGSTEPAAAVGGDYFDFIPIEETKVAFCIGDISGKGVPAALLMSNLQASLRSQAKINNTVKDSVTFSNKLLYENTDPERFATLMYGILNPESNEIVFCNAGHNNPFLFSADGNVKELKTGGLLLGCFPGSIYEEEKISINRNDLIVVFSDGISEAMNENEEEYGENRLKVFISNHIAESAEKLIANILSDVKKFVGKVPQWDDMTLLIIKREEL